jgi:hypothetical protein
MVRPTPIRLAFAFAMVMSAAVIGCFASIDRSKIADDGDSSTEGGAVDPDATAAVDGADGARRPDAGAAPGCSGLHELCVDFDDAGTTPEDFGFEPLAPGDLGTGVVTIEMGGRSLPRSARIKTPPDPLNKPGLGAGLKRSLDPQRGLALSFDVLVERPNWAGYDAAATFVIAKVTTGNDNVTLTMHVQGTKVDSGASEVAIVLIDPEGQTEQRAAPFAFGSWFHVDIAAAPSGVTVMVENKKALSRGPISFTTSGRPYNLFFLGVTRELPVPATDVRIDNVVFDYK